ncbi:TPA: RNA-binding protein [Candidatus Saccharibacteria bacterium]|nr:MAG: hypothetical protein UX30_C0005G0063 [Candidatus Saccharibacteria bacterium GW2011_GWA2_46_10]OGL36135.1 MAG: RNA-binding protein [Candidatus Saccharibacteria bacterium RIFCSPHIGHO2_12_FULL_47_17]HCM52155.1 RNA-binding protein [Candidatus Saccharibacteria bacterium]
MSSKLYVGSLPYSVDDNKLKELFAQFGTVVSAQVIVDRDSNQSKGFGFVEMKTEDEAKEAIKALNGKDMDGRSIMVNEARPKEHAGGGFDRGRRSF